MKKAFYIIMLLAIGFFAHHVYSNTEYNRLVKIADRQAVEIAIIEQTSKLVKYKQLMANSKKEVVDSNNVE